MFGLFNELREFGERVFGCICCLALGGPILIIAGIATFVASATDDRSSKIASYNNAVDAWTKLSPVGGPAFRLNNYTLAFGSASTGLLRPTTTPTEVPQFTESGGDIKTYTSRFAFEGPVSFASGFAGWDLYYTVTVQDRAGGQVTLPQARAAYRALTNPCSSGDNTLAACQNKCPGGAISGFSTSSPASATCTTYRVLNYVCVIVNPGAAPIADPSSGCAVAPGGGLSNYAYYTVASQVSIQSTLTSVPVYVKSSADPWATAVRLTSGSMSFGLTVAQKQQLGGVLLGVGVVWTVLVCGGVFILVRHCSHRKVRRNGVLVSAGGAPGGGVVLQGGAPPPPQVFYDTPVGQQAYAPQPQAVAHPMLALQPQYPMQQPPPQQQQQPYYGQGAPQQYGAQQQPYQQPYGQQPNPYGAPVYPQPGQVPQQPAPYGWTPGGPGQQPPAAGYPAAYPQPYPQQQPYAVAQPAYPPKSI